MYFKYPHTNETKSFWSTSNQTALPGQSRRWKLSITSTQTYSGKCFTVWVFCTTQQSYSCSCHQNLWINELYSVLIIKNTVTMCYKTRDILRSSQKQPEAIIKWEVWWSYNCEALSPLIHKLPHYQLFYFLSFYWELHWNYLLLLHSNLKIALLIDILMIALKNSFTVHTETFPNGENIFFSLALCIFWCKEVL